MSVAVAADVGLVGGADGDGVVLVGVDVVAVGGVGRDVDGAQADDGATQQEEKDYDDADEYTPAGFVAPGELETGPVDVLGGWHSVVFDVERLAVELVVLRDVLNATAAGVAHAAMSAGVVEVVLVVELEALGLCLFVLEVHVG